MLPLTRARRTRPAALAAAVPVAALLSALVAAPALPAAAAEPGELLLVSRAADGTQGDAPSGTSGLSTSAGGSVVAFASSARTLDPADTDGELDVYVRDTRSGSLTLASTSSTGTKADRLSLRPSLDAAGDRVAFTSGADDLDPADPDQRSDVYVKDLATGVLTLASTDPSGRKGDGDTTGGVLSADGRTVAFVSRSDDLLAADPDAAPDVYVKHLDSGALELASVAADGTRAAAGDYGVGEVSVSADGTTVAFDTDAALDPRDTGTGVDVYVKDLVHGSLTLASVTPDGLPAGGYRPSLSADGSAVAFDSYATALDPADTTADDDVYVADLGAGTVRVASTDAAGAALEGRATDASLSADGTAVAFSSSEPLDPADTNGLLDTWVKDLTSGSVVLASATADGSPADALSIAPELSGDGSTVVFATPAALDPADANGWADVYARRLAAPDPDPDPEPGPDTTPPTVQVSATPDHISGRAWLRAPVTVTGTAADEHGLDRVELRVVDEYGFVRRPLDPVAAGGAPTATWTRTISLPLRVRASDTDGRTYRVEARAVDTAGNVTNVSTTVVAVRRAR